MFREVGNDFAYALYAIGQERARSEADSALLEAKERYLTLFESAGDAIFIHDTSGRILEVNSATCERLSYGRGELEEMMLADIEDPEFRERRISYINRINRDGQTMYETVHRTRDGVLIPVEMSSRLIEYRGGQAVLSIARDITERKRHEKETALYRLAVEASGDMLVAIDSDYRYILANEAFLRYHGLRREEFIGRSASDFIEKNEYVRDIKPRLDRCMTGEEIRFELKRYYPYIGECWQHLSYFPLRGENQEIRGVVVSMADITQRKNHEAEMALYHNAVEASGEMIVAADTSYRYIMANSAYLSFMGYRREELLGKTIADVLGEKRFGELKMSADRCMAGEYIEFEVSYQHPEHGLREGIISFCPMKSGDSIAGVVATIHDITERKQMNDALLESETRYRALFENMLNGFVHLKAETNDSGKVVNMTVLDVNSSLERLVGMSKDLMVGRSVTELFPELRNAKYDWIGELGQVALTGIGIEQEAFVAGSDKWVVFNAFSPMKGYVAALFEDITERRLTEQSLARERYLQRALMDNIPLNIYFKDRESRFIMINRYMVNKFKLNNASEAVGKTDRDFHSPDIAKKAYEDEQRIMTTGVPMINVEEHEIWPDGSETWITTTKVPLRNENGDITGIVGISPDITGQKLLENQLRQAQKMETVARLAGGVAHDFNNMLTAIMGYCNLLLIELPEGTNREDVMEILATSQRAADLTRQLLAFSRRQIIKPKVVNLNEILTNLDRMLGRLIGENITMVLRVSPDLWPVRIDPGQMEQVLTNLAVNARDAMPEGGMITIETSNVELDAQYALVHPDVHPGPHVMLSVTDTGEGMDANVAGRIFEPFFTTKGRGTGLGLSTCYGIVKQNRGNIWVYSEKGKGSSFKIYLPRAEGMVESSAPAPAGTELPTGTECILLAEDEKAVRDASQRMLTGLGYNVIPAEDGLHALELAGKDGIDLLITDVIMPRMGGKELAETLLARNPGIRVLYISGYTDHAIVSHGILEEGIAFIQKPFMAADFARKIREVLDGE